MKAKGKHNGGYTLIEILVALAILGIIIPPVIGLFTAASGSNHRSIRNTVALTVARDIMDRIKAGDINTANQDDEIEEYREKHGVEVFVPGITSGAGNTLEMLKVYVAPKQGMEPETEGIMLASYATNVFIEEIDTTQLYDPGSGGDDEDPPGPEDDEGPDLEELWVSYLGYAMPLPTVAPHTKPTVLVLPYILFEKVPEIQTMKQAVTASYSVLLTAKKTPPNDKLNWGHLANEVETYYEFRLNPNDHKKYQPYQPNS